MSPNHRDWTESRYKWQCQIKTTMLSALVSMSPICKRVLESTFKDNVNSQKQTKLRHQLNKLESTLKGSTKSIFSTFSQSRMSDFGKPGSKNTVAAKGSKTQNCYYIYRTSILLRTNTFFYQPYVEGPCLMELLGLGKSRISQILH